MARVIGKKEYDAAFLIETRAEDGRRYGRVHDARRDELFPEMLVASIAARGYWVEVEPNDHPDVIEKLSDRLG